MPPITTRTISHKAWNSHLEYPSWENKFDTKASDGNMLKKAMG